MQPSSFNPRQGSYGLPSSQEGDPNAQAPSKALPLPPSGEGDSSGNTKSKVTERARSLFKKASKGDSGDVKSSPSISKARGSEAAVQARSGGISRLRKSTGDLPDRKETLPEMTITPQGILDLYTGLDTLHPQVTFPDALKYVHSMGQELVEVWHHPTRGMSLFDERIHRFVTTILPELEMMQLLRRTKTLRDVASLEDLPDDVIALRSKYSAKPIHLNAQSNALDRILFYIFEAGRALVEAWDNPDKELDLKAKIDNLKKQAQPRFNSVNQQEQKHTQIQSINFASAMEKSFQEDVEKLLQGVLLDLKQPINSPENRAKILKLLSNDGEIKRKLEELDNLSNPGGVVKALTTMISKMTSSRGDRDESKKTTDEEYKLDKDYVILSCAYQLCEMLTTKYCAALEGICQELQRPALCQGEPSSIGLVKEIAELVNTHIKSPWATINRHPANVTRELFAIVRSRIEFLELPVLKKGMTAPYRAMLVQNMALRQCQIRSFHHLLESLIDKLYSNPMKTPQDVPRAFTLNGNVCCKINGEEVQAESDSPEGRFKAFLRTMSELFGQPKMFFDLAQLMGFPLVPHAKRTMESVYLDAYKKLMTLDGSERSALKEQFEEIYGLDTFEKAFKYFKVFQNILEQGILYHFAGALLKSRMQKFNLASIGFVKPLEKEGFKKNEFKIEVNGSRCKCRIIRYDGLLHHEVLLRQEYSIVFDLDQDEIIIPTKEQVLFNIECPSHLKESDEIRTLLFDLSLIMESLDFPSLQITYIESFKSKSPRVEKG